MTDKVVSPFEYAIMQIADPEKAKGMRPETESEKQVQLKVMATDFAKRIKVKK